MGNGVIPGRGCPGPLHPQPPNPALTSPAPLLGLPGPAPRCRHSLGPGSERPLGTRRAVGRAPSGSASGSSYIPGGQRLPGNGQSEALKLPWVRPTELLGLPPTLPDVTLLLHKRDGETRGGGCAGCPACGGPRASSSLREAGSSVTARAGLGLRRLLSRWQRATLNSRLGSGTRSESHPPISWPCDLWLVPRSL